MPLLSLRFQKFDQFNNPVFIASTSRSDEQETFNQLAKYHKTLAKCNYGTFLPIYANLDKQYATIRFKKSDSYTRMKPRATYSVEFNVATLTKDDKTYVNCFISKLSLQKEAPKINVGTILNLD